jgi:hypothetical protein
MQLTLRGVVNGDLCPWRGGGKADLIAWSSAVISGQIISCRSSPIRSSRWADGGMASDIPAANPQLVPMAGFERHLATAQVPCSLLVIIGRTRKLVGDGVRESGQFWLGLCLELIRLGSNGARACRH